MAIDPDDIARKLVGRRLVDALTNGHREGLERGHNIAQDVTGGGKTFDPNDPAVRKIMAEGGDRITGILDVTREAVRGYVATGVQRGMGVNEIAALIRADPSGAFKPARARLIARTETATMLSRGTVHGYRVSGRVSEVEVMDGAGCSWPEGHGVGDEANGMIVSLDEAEQHPIAHPNCTRAFAPVVAR